MKYTYDSTSLMRDGKRWFPIMGEIHYSRVPCAFWKEELCKMKAGGVDVVSAYTIWIHHEEIEGEYDWTGDRNLHEFISSAKECGMKILLRIGPWSHGEVRNGGFPDWLLKKDFEPRTNDERYFEYARRWYEAVYSQVAEFVGSTIIGVQIENEYGHCGGLYEKESGEEHMRTLKKIAEDVGFKVDIYTATGWGGAWTGGMIPVMGGYCDAPWDQRVTEIEPSGNYTFTHERNDHNIGSDHGFGYGVTFDMEKFPYLTAELGGGLQVTNHRRTIATAKDIAAVATVKMGSGVNLLGFYMYHGGTNPEGKLTTLQESTETGYLNDLPIKNYDFRAPVREFGQVSDTLRELKLLSYFASDFGSEFCTLPAIIPDENPLDPNDTEKLRYSFRTDGKKGYLFVNNYVRHQTLKEHLSENIRTPGGTVFKNLNVKNGDFFFLPFNMEFGGNKIRSASVTPLLHLKNENLFVFYERDGEKSESAFFDFDGDGTGANFLVLSRKDALNTWRVKDRLFVTAGDSYVLENSAGKTEITGRGKCSFLVYPDFPSALAGWKKVGSENLQKASDLSKVEFFRYEREIPPETFTSECKFEKIGENSYRIDVCEYILEKEKEDGIFDFFLNIDYAGSNAKIYATVGGERKLILDDFWLGEGYPWEIGMRQFFASNFGTNGMSGKIGTDWEIEITPLSKNQKIYLEKRPVFDGDEISELRSVSVQREWRFSI